MAEKILIVDDDLDTLRLVGLLLERKGYEIIAADRGSQGLEKALSDIPDLILLDVMMPDMDGFEILRKLRSNEATSDIPIIMFTAKNQVEDKVAGFEAGADDYLTKPTHPAELTARVQATLARFAFRRTPQPIHRQREKGTVLGVLAPKGGLGTTTLALNLAYSFYVRSGEDIILADLRPGNGSLSLALGYKNRSSFSNLLEKDPRDISAADVQSALVSYESKFRLLLSSYLPSDAKYCMAVDQFVTIVKQLSNMAKYIILDYGPSLPSITQATLEQCDKLLIVTEPYEITIVQTKALLDELSLQVLGLGRINVVLVNRIPWTFSGSRFCPCP
jgi:CheY-like chemotaxis protein/cellulose biosynthesis protein BcsQ